MKRDTFQKRERERDGYEYTQEKNTSIHKAKVGVLIPRNVMIYLPV